ncbi:alpha/beta hydrolase [uncultured Caulobacter sp.]|uniref:alpha/beta hydrolase family protein n=1 Tax=uncultured Caulobacter sp. TaxID=158749 RepID=UPI00262D53D7|nr:alpha/beta hydrolase [uncultured Caulobacter sp.]
MKLPILAATLAMVLAGAAAAAEPAPPPYLAVMESDPSLPTHTVYRPADLTAVGKAKLPILAWANGACANEGDAFAKFLTEIAGHGYLVVAIGPIVGPKPPNAGPPPRPDMNAPPKTTSSQLIDAIDWAIAENARPSSRYKGRLDVQKIAVMGMSCGGLQAIEASADPRVTTTGVWNSGVLGTGTGGLPGANVTKASLKALHGPAIYVSGDASDIAFGNANDDFARIDHIPVVRAYEDGVGHGGTYGQARGGAFGEVAVAWLNWQLKGDAAGRAMFVGPECGLCARPGWHVEAKGLK